MHNLQDILEIFEKLESNEKILKRTKKILKDDSN